MKTEEIQRRPRGRDPNEVSRALQELTPRAWSVVDRRGRAVPLTSAGYVLRFGQAYHLRLVSPFKREDVEQVYIDNPPPFISVQPGRFDREEQGYYVYDLPFKVNLDPWAHLRRLGMSVLGDDLEVVHGFRPGAYGEAPTFLCPIVVRPRWATVIVGVLGGLLFILLEKLLTGLFVPNRNIQDGIGDLLEALSRGHSWGFFAMLAGRRLADREHGQFKSAVSPQPGTAPAFPRVAPAMLITLLTRAFPLGTSPKKMAPTSRWLGRSAGDAPRRWLPPRSEHEGTGRRPAFLVRRCRGVLPGKEAQNHGYSLKFMFAV